MRADDRMHVRIQIFSNLVHLKSLIYPAVNKVYFFHLKVLVVN